MKQSFSPAVLVAEVLGVATSACAAEQSRAIEFPAPVVKGGDSIKLKVTTGSLAQGARLVVMTENGELLGAAAPYVGRGKSITSILAIPLSVLAEGRLRLRLQVVEPGAPGRAPQAEEVERVDLIVTPQSK